MKPTLPKALRELPRRVRTLLCLVVAALLWLPLLPWLHDPTGNEAQRMLSGQMAAIADRPHWQQQTAKLRAGNPEWDLMRRTFTALALADAAFPEVNDSATQAAAVAALDVLVNDLVADLNAAPDAQFLLPYAKQKAFVGNGRSIFVDGEVALILEARLALGGRADLIPLADSRLDFALSAMQSAPNFSAESYPDEAWTFCNTTALAALKLHDVRTKSDHRGIAQAWIAHAKAHLVDARTGMLVSRYTMQDAVMEGPEGSSIFMVAQNLALWDAEFARDQYTRAKSHLMFQVLGFGLAREWPLHTAGDNQDVDSGPVVPLLGASPGSSGLALVGAAVFKDEPALRALMRSLRVAAVPRSAQEGMSYLAAGPMGNAVILHALHAGPLWAYATSDQASTAAVTRRTP